MGDADEEAAAAEAAPPRMDEDGNIIDSPKPIRRRPFSLRRMVGDVRRKLKKEMQVPPTYGPPYLENMPHIDIGLIDQCDQGEPNAQEIHGVLNEGVNPNCTDPENFGETPLFKIGRHCGGRDVMKIVEMLKMAGVKGAMCVDKVNELGLTPLCRAAMSAPPPGPPKKIRLKFIQWLIDEHANVNHVDKGGFTPLCHAASHGDYDGVRLLLENGAEVEPVSGMGVKRPVKDAVQMGRMSATVKFPAKDRKKELVAILERYKFMQATARDKAESERRKALMESAEDARQLAIFNASREGTPAASMAGRPLSDDQKRERIADLKAIADRKRAAVKAGKKAEKNKLLKELAEAEHKNGSWHKHAKYNWEYHAGEVEESNGDAVGTLATAQLHPTHNDFMRLPTTIPTLKLMYDELTNKTGVSALKTRWLKKTGLNRRDPFVPLPKLV